MENVKSLINKAVSKKGTFKIPGYWMNKILNDLVDTSISELSILNKKTNTVNSRVDNLIISTNEHFQIQDYKIDDIIEKMSYVIEKPSDFRIDGSEIIRKTSPNNHSIGYVVRFNNPNNWKFTYDWSVTGDIANNIKYLKEVSRKDLIYIELNDNYDNSFISGELKVTLYNELFNYRTTVTKKIQIVPEAVVLTSISNSEMQKVLYDAGLVANEHYSYQYELEAITIDQLYPNGATYSIIRNVGSFDELKYFKSITEWPENFIGAVETIEVPEHVTTLNNDCIWDAGKLYIPSTVTECHLGAVLGGRVGNLYVDSLDWFFTVGKNLKGGLHSTVPVYKRGNWKLYVSNNIDKTASNNNIRDFVIDENTPLTITKLRAIDADSITFDCSTVYTGYILDSLIKYVHLGDNVHSLSNQCFGNVPLVKITGGKNITTISADVFMSSNSITGKTYTNIFNIELDPEASFGFFYDHWLPEIKYSTIKQGTQNFYWHSAIPYGEYTVKLPSGICFTDGSSTKNITFVNKGYPQLMSRVLDLRLSLTLTDNIENGRYLLEYVDLAGNNVSEEVSTGTCAINTFTPIDVKVTPLTAVNGYDIPNAQTILLKQSLNECVFKYNKHVDVYLTYNNTIYTVDEFESASLSAPEQLLIVVENDTSFLIRVNWIEWMYYYNTYLMGGYDIPINISGSRNGYDFGLVNTKQIEEALSGVTDAYTEGSPAVKQMQSAYLIWLGNIVDGYIGTKTEWEHLISVTDIVQPYFENFMGNNWGGTGYWTSTVDYVDSKKTFHVNFDKLYNTAKITSVTRRIKNNILPFYSPWSLDIKCNQQDVKFNVTYTKLKTLETKTVTLGTGLSSVIVPEPKTQVTISVAPGYEWAMINNPTQTITYSGPMTVSFTAAVDSGVYIQHVNGELYTRESWTESEYTYDDANGIAVIDPTCSFVISKDAKPELQWGGYGIEIGLPYSSMGEAGGELEYDGLTNTNLIIESLENITDANGIVGSPAASYCKNYTFPNGKSGYLPASGELITIMQNNSDINSCLNCINGTRLDVTSNYYSSSTHYTDQYILCMNMFNYEYLHLVGQYKYYTHRVIPICPLY